MELLGDRNWWLPGWLARLLPNIDVEGHGEALVAPRGEDDDEAPVPVGV
jgi:RND superfamily putative drug exporter